MQSNINDNAAAHPINNNTNQKAIVRFDQKVLSPKMSVKSRRLPFFLALQVFASSRPCEGGISSVEKALELTGDLRKQSPSNSLLDLSRVLGTLTGKTGFRASLEFWLRGVSAAAVGIPLG